MLNKEKILKLLKIEKKYLRQKGVTEIGLFGSYSQNTQHKESDIDLLVDFEPKHETFDNLMAVHEILENTFKNYKVEIVTKNGLSKYIGSYILKETIYA
ncbi:MAG: nucleotidyltransferase family protein [Bacteroidota bacterium]|nr:nucleotidyltransferase family protein [Bacteroidota bacterium]